MRNIDIDTDTSYGYIFEEKSFYVTNKGTTTKRLATVKEINDRLQEAATETKQVLDIVAPDNTVTIDDLISLATTYEELKDLYFTYSNNGSYIYSIQLNDYAKNPIVMDAEKKKLYIMNTDIIYNLPLNDSKLARLEYIQAFYHDTLGLSVELPELTSIYNLLVQFYSPTCYNEITTIKNADETYSYVYNNYVKLSNYNETANTVYSLQANPYGEYTPELIGNILRIEENAITCTTDMTELVKVGSTVEIKNTDYSMGAYNYSANGTAKVSSVVSNVIYTTENLPSSFIYQPATLYISAYETQIVSVDRDSQTITLTNSEIASSYLVGDKIRIKGTAIPTEYETLTVDGTYTIMKIEDNVIYTEEIPTTNYTGSNGFVFKPIEVGTCNTVENNTIRTDEGVPNTVTVGTQIAVTIPKADVTAEPTWLYGTVSAISEDKKTVTVETAMGVSYTAHYGEICKQKPSPIVLINVSKSKIDENSLYNSDSPENAKEFPIGQFMVDNWAESLLYLGLTPHTPLPNTVPPLAPSTSSFESNINSEVPSTFPLEVSPDKTFNMQLLGTATTVYS